MQVLFVLNPLLSLLISAVLYSVWQKDKTQLFARDIAVWTLCFAPIGPLFQLWSSSDPWAHAVGTIGLPLFAAMGHAAFLQGVRRFAASHNPARRTTIAIFIALAAFYLLITLLGNPRVHFGIAATLLVGIAGAYVCYKLWHRGGAERFLGLLLIGGATGNVVVAIGGTDAVAQSQAVSIFFRCATSLAVVMAALARSAERLERLQLEQVAERAAAAQHIQDTLQQANAVLEQRVNERTHALAAANANLAQTNTQMERALTVLQQTQVELVQREKLASLGRMVAGIAHELNTPIGNAVTIGTAMGARFKTIKAQVDAGQLKKSELDAFFAEGADAALLLEKSLSRASTLIDNFRQVARDNSTETPAELSLSLLLNEVAASVRPALESVSIRLATDIAGGVEITSCPGQISQVVFQLVENAKTHAFVGVPPGEIRLALCDAGEHVHIEVGDTGRGINPELEGHIFDPFATTRMGHSLGLGLNMVHTLVTRRLGGKIAVAAAVPQGTCFTIQLPKTAPDI
ncbi:MAG: HAMP domain-containing sensor histidine kinase [Pseudomonadota bacterium]